MPISQLEEGAGSGRSCPSAAVELSLAMDGWLVLWLLFLGKGQEQGFARPALEGWAVGRQQPPQLPVWWRGTGPVALVLLSGPELTCPSLLLSPLTRAHGAPGQAGPARGAAQGLCPSKSHQLRSLSPKALTNQPRERRARACSFCFLLFKIFSHNLLPRSSRWECLSLPSNQPLALGSRPIRSFLLSHVCVFLVARATHASTVFCTSPLSPFPGCWSPPPL